MFDARGIRVLSCAAAAPLAREFARGQRVRLDVGVDDYARDITGVAVVGQSVPDERGAGGLRPRVNVGLSASIASGPYAL